MLLLGIEKYLNSVILILYIALLFYQHPRACESKQVIDTYVNGQAYSLKYLAKILVVFSETYQRLETFVAVNRNAYTSDLKMYQWNATAAL